MSGRGTRKRRRLRDFTREDWRRVARRVWDEIDADNLTMIAAGVAFYAMLALFPGLIALVNLYSLSADPQDIHDHLRLLAGFLPREVLTIIAGQLQALVDDPPTGLSLGLLVSVLVVLWSTSSGIQNLVQAINLAYGVKEKRSYFRLRALALTLTLVTIVFFSVAVSLVAVLPAVLELYGLETAFGIALAWLRWPVLAVGLMLALGLLYRLAPSRIWTRWRWLSPGAAVATAIWLLGSALFSLYVSNFGRFNETYGSLGVAVVLLLWLYLSAFIVLLGAEINSEIERVAREDKKT